MSNIENENKASKKSFIDRFKEKIEAKKAHKAEVAEQHQRIISSMSEAEYAEMKLEKMRYFDNSISHKLGYAGILCSLIAMFIALNTMSPAYYMGGVGVVIAILMNIAILLTGFLTVEKVKAYSIGYSIYSIVLGGLCVLRIFWFPLSTVRLYNEFWGKIKDTSAWDSTTQGNKWEVIKGLYQNKLGSSIINGTPVDANGNAISVENLKNDTSIIDHIATEGYLTANGNIRFVIMTLFLAIAAACFISAGVIGYIKSVKLRNYLNSKKEN